MAIEETLELVDNASAPLNAAADAASALASAADDARSSLDGAWGSELDATADAADDATSAVEDTTGAIEDAGDAAGDAGQDGAAAFEQMGEAAQGLNAGLEVIGKIGKGVGKVLALAVAFGEAVVEAHGFNAAATAALDQLTGGRGEAALESLTVLAAGLGQTTAETVEEFTALRDAGASNADATALIKLGADLEAVGVSAGATDDAIAAAMARIKKGEDSAAVIADVASAFGAVGDGANAAARRALTLEGAIDNAGSVAERAFQGIAGTAGPQLDAIGAKITSVLDAFEESGAIGDAGTMIAAALEYVPPIIDGILAAWESLSASAQPGIEALSMAWDDLSAALGEGGTGMSAASAIGSALGFVISTIANVIAGAVAAAAAMATAFGAVTDAGTAFLDAVNAIPEALAEINLSEAGTELVNGFIEGMLGSLGAVVDAAAGLGEAAEGAIKGALGIASPSKIGLDIGDNLGTSVGTGTADAMLETIEPPELGDIPEIEAASGGAGSAAPAGGAPIINVQITIEGTSATPADLEAASRRGIEAALAARAAA